jgi:hypothetical protein
MANIYTVKIRNRFTVIVFTIAIVGLVALVFTVGMAVLATVVVAGGLIGLGVGIFNRLRSGLHQLPSTHHDHVEPVLKQQLDPSLEVQPVRPAIVKPKIDIEL